MLNKQKQILQIFDSCKPKSPPPPTNFLPPLSVPLITCSRSPLDVGRQSPHEDILFGKPCNVCVFGDLNIYQKDWLAYSGETGRPGEICYNFCISNDLTQMVNFPTGIPDCDSHIPALLGLFISSNTCIFFTMVFSPLGNSNHGVV